MVEGIDLSGRSVKLSDIHRNWSQYVQSPTQLAYSRFTRFPPGSEDRLRKTLGIQSDQDVLDIGSGLGILADRLRSPENKIRAWECELNEEYLDYELPESLSLEKSGCTVQADGFKLPFPEDFFECATSHALATLITGDQWSELHDEIRRVLHDEGRIIHMDNMNNESWYPSFMKLEQDAEECKKRFDQLCQDVHHEINTGYAHTAHNLAGRMRKVGLDNLSIDTYTWTMHWTNSTLTKQQKLKLIELQKKAEMDRIQCLENLLDDIDELTPEYNRCISSYRNVVTNQFTQRKNALLNDEPLGWDSVTTLVASGTF